MNPKAKHDEDLMTVAPEHRQWASVIKDQHYHLQKQVLHQAQNSDQGATSPDATVVEEVKLWQEAITSPKEHERLTTYATSMYNLATKYWDSNHTIKEESVGVKRQRDGQEEEAEKGKEGGVLNKYYNDRITYCLSGLTSYFLGTLNDPPRKEVIYKTLPVIFSKAVKLLRRDFFEKFQRLATPVEVEGFIDQVEVGTGEETAWRKALQYRNEAMRDDLGKEALPPITVLDVGSCYGPFAGMSLPFGTSTVPLEVTSVDLQPYSESSLGGERRLMWKGDWVSMEFFSEKKEAVDSSPMSRLKLSGPSTDIHSTLLGVRVESFDAVFFCLLLSYLPTPRLRFLCCAHAYLALKPGGLLVIVSTRTQGSRKQPWVDMWTKGIESIGFRRVNVQISTNIVGLSFSKVEGSSSADLTKYDDRAQWLTNTMLLPCANSALKILADS